MTFDDGQSNESIEYTQQHTNPEPTTKNRSAGGGGAGKTSKKRKRNQDLGPGAPRQPVNGMKITILVHCNLTIFLKN